MDVRTLLQQLTLQQNSCLHVVPAKSVSDDAPKSSLRTGPLTGNMITALVLVEISAAIGTRLRDLANKYSGQFFVLYFALLFLCVLP